MADGDPEDPARPGDEPWPLPPPPPTSAGAVRAAGPATGGGPLLPPPPPPFAPSYGRALPPAPLAGPSPAGWSVPREGGLGAFRVVLALGAACAVIAAACVGLVMLAGGAGGDTAVGGCHLPKPWACHEVTVPKDHTAGGDGGTITIIYAVHPPAAPVPDPPRVMVYAEGGPGSSGLTEAQGTWDQLPPEVRDTFTFVVFEARGAGGTMAHACGAAESVYAASDAGQEASRTFVADCLEQAGVAVADLPLYATSQVIEDVDAIRAHLGADRFTMLGSSYGTVVAQAYAEAHPDRLIGLVLDAPVDRTVPAATLWAQSALADEAALRATLSTCKADPDCSVDMPDPAGTYARLLREVDRPDGISADVVGTDGRARSRSLSLADVEGVAYIAMYDTTYRMLWLRALAHYEHADASMLIRLADSWGFAGSSSFGYFATWCADSRVSPTARDDDWEAFVDVGADLGVSEREQRTTARVLAPCLYWPAQPSLGPLPTGRTDVPTLVLTATSDHVTPASWARAIVARLPTAALVETRGGAHVSIGEACPAAAFETFVLDGRLPSTRTSACIGEVVATYWPLAASPALTADDLVEGFLYEILAAPEVLEWDGTGDLTLGCGVGGTVEFSEAADARVHITLNACAMTPGEATDGSGWLDLDSWDGVLSFRSERADLEWDGTGGGWKLDGTWDGKAVHEDD